VASARTARGNTGAKTVWGTLSLLAVVLRALGSKKIDRTMGGGHGKVLGRA
jgi:hypothetical protein